MQEFNKTANIKTVLYIVIITVLLSSYWITSVQKASIKPF